MSSPNFFEESIINEIIEFKKVETAKPESINEEIEELDTKIQYEIERVEPIRQKNIENLMTSLAVFIAASFRLLPSITRILGSLQTLRYTNAVTKLLIKDLKLDEKFRPINENYKATKDDLNFFKTSFENILFDENFLSIFKISKFKRFILEIS